MNQLILMAHVLFGVACLVTTVWIFADVLNASKTNLTRIRKMSYVAALFMWLAFLIGGYWYVSYYKADKTVVLKGPWPLAHSLCMETKEHLAIMLLMVVNYLPIAAAGDLLESKDARRVVLWVSGLAALLVLVMEGEGGIIAMGVKMALLTR